MTFFESAQECIFTDSFMCTRSKNERQSADLRIWWESKLQYLAGMLFIPFLHLWAVLLSKLGKETLNIFQIETKNIVRVVEKKIFLCFHCKTIHSHGYIKAIAILTLDPFLDLTLLHTFQTLFPFYFSPVLSSLCNPITLNTYLFHFFTLCLPSFYRKSSTYPYRSFSLLLSKKLKHINK